MDTPTAITHIGKYDILGELGRGGMGVVYRGEDKFIGREVAIKTLTDATPELRQRFLVEARSGVLNHQNIVTVYDFGEQDGNPYIVMEYLHGDSLEKILRSGEPLSMLENLEIIRQVCAGLGYAHQKGVIHRDIKPANVMVQPNRQAKIVDFGIARLESASGQTQTGAVIGTFHYISPERLKGEASDGRADIWSTGVMLYQMLTGRLPFGGEDVSALHKVVNEPFDPLSTVLANYPPVLDQVMERALAKNPADRYDTAEEMAADIDQISEELKRVRVGEVLDRVKGMVEQQQFASARPVLLDLQRLDPQNAEVKRLLREVQERLARQQKSEQFRQLRGQAEEAALSQHYAEAIELYKQASKLDPDAAGLAEKIEHLRGLKEKAEKVTALHRGAREARERSDFGSAAKLIDQALELDRNNTDLRNERARILQESERAAKEAARQRLSKSGREKLEARQYAEAVEHLRQALEIDPTDGEVQQMFQDATARQEEERRRKVIEQIVAEIQECIHRDNFDRALELIQRSLEKLPGETALLRLKAEMEKRQREAAAQRLVEQTSLQVQDLFLTDPQRALACVQEALDRMPGEARLIALEERVIDQLKRANLDGLRAQYLSRAQTSIEARQFDQAIQILETAAIECGEAEDVVFLLDLARAEKQKDELQRVSAAAMQQAQVLIGNGELEAAVAILEPAVAETCDPALQQLLRQTSANLAEVARRIDAVVNRVQTLSEQDAAQALQLLLSQPQAIQQHSRLRALRARVDTSSEQSRLTREAIKQAEDLLAKKDLRKGLEMLESVARAYGDSPRLNVAVADYKVRRIAIANGIVVAATGTARQSILAQNAPRALEELRGAADAMEFADAAVQADWKRLAQEAAKAAGTKRSSTDKVQIVVQSGRPSGLVLGSIAAVVLVIIGVVVWFLQPAPRGFLELNATPFAEVVSVTPENGKQVVLPAGDHMTPLRLDGLAPGTYTVVFKGQDGVTNSKCVVGESQPVCSVVMHAISDSEMDQIVGGER